MYLYEQLAAERKEADKYNELLGLNQKNPPTPKGDKSFVAVLGSMSHTYGNALAFMENWIINLFPDDLFKTVHVNSKIAHRQIRSTPNEYIKKVKPMIIFRPRIPGIDEDRFMKGTPLIEKQTDLYNIWGSTNLMPFFHDEKHDLSINFQMNRTVLYVDVVLVFSTLMQQIDYFQYIINSVRINKPLSLNTCFESYIPQDMLAIISALVDIPLYDENGNTLEFLTYMNQNSIYPMTYKLQGSTRTREFYRYYPVNIDTIIMDLDKDDGERVGNIMNQYQISFSVRMEFNSAGFYYLVSDKIHHIDLPKVHPENTDIIPVFTDVYLKEDLNIAPGWHLYNQASYRLEKPDDEVDFSQMLNHSIKTAMEYHKLNGLPYTDIIDIKIRRQGKLMHKDQDYFIDWEKYLIRFNSQNMFFTYSIIVNINIEYINELMKVLYNLK